MGKSHEGVVFIAGTDYGLDRRNDPVFLANFAVLLTSQADRVYVTLLGITVGLARAGHDDSYAAVKTVFLVGYVDSIVDEGAEEITFSKL